jgi:hypothetical protein
MLSPSRYTSSAYARSWRVPPDFPNGIFYSKIEKQWW